MLGRNSVLKRVENGIFRQKYKVLFRPVNPPDCEPLELIRWLLVGWL